MSRSDGYGWPQTGKRATRKRGVFLALDDLKWLSFLFVSSEEKKSKDPILSRRCLFSLALRGFLKLTLLYPFYHTSNLSVCLFPPSPGLWGFLKLILLYPFYHTSIHLPFFLPPLPLPAFLVVSQVDFSLPLLPQSFQIASSRSPASPAHWGFLRFTLLHPFYQISVLSPCYLPLLRLGYY